MQLAITLFKLFIYFNVLLLIHKDRFSLLSLHRHDLSSHLLRTFTFSRLSVMGWVNSPRLHRHGALFVYCRTYQAILRIISQGRARAPRCCHNLLDRRGFP